MRPRAIACSMLVTLTGIGDWSSGRAMREPVTTIPSPPLACDPSSPAGDGACWAKAGAAAAINVAVDAARNKFAFNLIMTSQYLLFFFYYLTYTTSRKTTQPPTLPP